MPPAPAQLGLRALVAALLLTVLAPAAAPARAPAPAVRPSVDMITCRTECAGIARGKAGRSVVRVTGEAVDGVVQVAFLGRRGRRDDRYARAAVVGPGAVEARLPRGARSGRVRLLTGDGRRSLRSRRTIQVGRRVRRRGRRLQVRADFRRVVLDGSGRRASVSFFSRRSVPLAVDVVRASDGAPVAHWELPAARAGAVRSVSWDGLVDGAPAPEGRYAWRVLAPEQSAQLRSASAGSSGAVALLLHRFPVAGPHRYGQGLGAGRGHEGQDVFAACGTPLVAAFGGVVGRVDTHAAAGNYVVIRGFDGVDYAYMHLRERSPLQEGQSVPTGELVGAVGETGRATGCHLHFEMWGRPGWGEGGPLIDPTPHLRAWDVA